MGAPVVLPAGDSSTRDRLLDAASEVFCEQGYEGTKVQEVARRAGLTTGAIYGNFRDKAELLLMAIDRSTTRWVEEWNRAREAGVSAADRLVLMGEALVADTASSDRRLLVEMFGAARRDPVVRRRVRKAMGLVEDDLMRVIERARRDGDIAAEVDTMALARFCLSLSMGYQQLDVAGRPPLDPDVWESIIRRFISAMAPRGSPAQVPDDRGLSQSAPLR